LKIIFTKHAKEVKFPLLAKHGFRLTEANVVVAINSPDHEDKDTEPPNVIASKSFDRRHVLRVVYKKEGDIIKVITFYPAEKGRYY